jgi:serine/threonine protein kinase
MQEQSLFTAALEKQDPAERAAFLDQACASDSALRQRIERLLQRHQEANSFLDSPAAAGVDSPQADNPGTWPTKRTSSVEEPTPPEGPGSVIGPYKLREQLGEGGMGLVFVAEQQHPVRRKVALKVIKPGMDTREVIARFEAERQALALMDHPHIAKVLDGGATGSGRPYFVMELVKGTPITEFCDQEQLPVRARLQLFLQVYEAVQHAHQKGIIHRDIKPSNVLVVSHDGTPAVKVIDFGVAKAIGQRLTDKTVYTHFAQLVGTPLYMSPEQAGESGLDIDTRSDIYSLGVLLYELLTGTTPFAKERFKEVDYDEMRRIIRGEEPPKPSTRISTLGQASTTIATHRKSDPRRLSQLFRGELDWIVMKALEKDRNRRYETASAFAADVQRYLHDEPVLACPPSVGYRLRKFARKYRMPLRIAGGFVVVLVLATAVSTWQAIRATRERDRAAASFRMARDAVDQLFTRVSQSPKLKAQGMEKFRKDLLQDAKGFYERFIREQFDDPAVRYDLGLAQYRLGEIHRELGDNAAAEESLTKAILLLGERVHEQPDVAEYQRDLAAGYATLGLAIVDTTRWEKAEAAFEQALAIQEKQAEAYPQAAEYRYALAKTYRESGEMYHRVHQPDSAAKRYQQALNILSKLVQDHPLAEHEALLAKTQMNLGMLCLLRGWPNEAETALMEAQRSYGRLVRGGPDVLPEYWQYLARSHALLGWAYRDQAEIDKAEAAKRQAHLERAESAQRQALEIFEKLAKEHPDVTEHAYDVGRCYFELAITADHAGQFPTALLQFDKAIEILEGAMSRGYHDARRTILGARLLRAGMRAGRGDHVRATAEAEAVARLGDMLPGNFYDIACVFSRASAAVDHDDKLSPADRTRLKTRYAEQAMDFLRQAVGKGWRHPQKLKTDPDIEALRTRADFRKLLADLEARTKE